MKKFIVSVTEDISHQYEIEAETKEEALRLYYKLTDEDLKEKDLESDAAYPLYRAPFYPNIFRMKKIR